MNKKTPQRRYQLKNKHDGNERIVVATSRAAAMTHVATTDWDIEILDMDNAIRLTREGVGDEVAGDPDQQALPLSGNTAVGGTD